MPAEFKHLPLSLKLRIWASKIIFLGRYRDGKSGQVIRLPLGRVAKLNAHPYELEAMEFVRTRTTIPLPKVLEVYHQNGLLHIVMEELPGNGREWENMNPDRAKIYMSELAGYIQQLRSLEPPREGFVGSISMGSLLDHRIGGERFGPYDSVADFHTFLRLNRPVADWQAEPDVTRAHSEPEKYSVKFCHADLGPRNIRFHKGHIVGIIDWEFAGWYPEYWEYTKLYWGQHPTQDKFYKALEDEPGISKYPQELDAERSIWKHMTPWSYDILASDNKSSHSQDQPGGSEAKSTQMASRKEEDEKTDGLANT